MPAFAIETRYLPPTNKLGGRIVATYGKCAKRVIGYDHGENQATNHRLAAIALREATHVGHGQLLLTTAETAAGYVHVWTA